MKRYVPVFIVVIILWALTRKAFAKARQARQHRQDEIDALEM